MKRYWFFKGIKIFILVVAFGALLTWAVMHIWNCLMPHLFNVPMINYWEALGILILSKILFGFGRGWGHRGCGYGGHYGGGWHHKGNWWKEKMEEKLKDMTPEERERFRARWQARCGGEFPFENEEKKEEAKP